MVNKRVLVDRLDSIYTLEINGEVKRVIDTSGCDEVPLDDIFLELKCSELPPSVDLFLSNDSGERLYDLINFVSIQRDGQYTRFTYELDAPYPLWDTYMLNAVLMLLTAYRIAEKNQWKVTDRFNDLEAPAFSVEFSVSQDIVIGEKIRSDISMFKQMLKTIQSDFVSNIKEGIFHTPD